MPRAIRGQAGPRLGWRRNTGHYRSPRAELSAGQWRFDVARRIFPSSVQRTVRAVFARWSARPPAGRVLRAVRSDLRSGQFSRCAGYPDHCLSGLPGHGHDPVTNAFVRRQSQPASGGDRGWHRSAQRANASRCLGYRVDPRTSGHRTQHCRAANTALGAPAANGSKLLRAVRAGLCRRGLRP